MRKYRYACLCGRTCAQISPNNAIRPAVIALVNTGLDSNNSAYWPQRLLKVVNAAKNTTAPPLLPFPFPPPCSPSPPPPPEMIPSSPPPPPPRTSPSHDESIRLLSPPSPCTSCSRFMLTQGIYEKKLNYYISLYGVCFKGRDASTRTYVHYEIQHALLCASVMLLLLLLVF